MYNQLFQTQIEQVSMNFIRQNISYEGENKWGKICIIMPLILYIQNADLIVDFERINSLLQIRSKGLSYLRMPIMAACHSGKKKGNPRLCILSSSE